MRSIYFLKILEKNGKIMRAAITKTLLICNYQIFPKGDKMEDKFTEGMMNISLDLMKKVSGGQKLTKEELAFIIMTKKMIQNQSKGGINDLIKKVEPLLPLLSNFL